MKRRILLILFICMLGITITGCSVEEASDEKLRDLEFTVVENEDISDELLSIIEEKKESEFKLTYMDNDYIYICIGYGEQATSGYSIAVNELYLTSNAIYVSTSLIGPSKDETVNEVASYPYIVIKTEYMDKSVVFE